jgi:hypothetical protein
MARTTAPLVTIEQVEEAIDRPFEKWAKDCHSVSIAIVKSDLFPYARVARGAAIGVAGQHSWVVLDHNVYDKYATIIDPTLWSYRADVDGIWQGRIADGIHFPKGMGSIWDYGRPNNSSYADAIELDTEGLSSSAKLFVQHLGPLDLRGWADLFNYPMEGWPSGEIVARAKENPRIAPFIPVDILGMVTDLNPSGLYLKD